MRSITSILFFLGLGACVDRLHYDIDIVRSGDYGISVDGFISDQTGPYRVNVNTVFDIESKDFIKTPVSVKYIIISDNHGVSEELTKINPGVYETKIGGIQGEVGRAYRLKLELLDGRVYESVPDTILPAGRIDSVYYKFAPVFNSKGAEEYGFDIFANSSRGLNTNNRFQWNMTGTFQSETHPECFCCGCFYMGGKCNFVPPCSGLRNIGNQANPEIVRSLPCECCTCWYNIFNEKPILSDNYFSSARTFSNLKIYRVPFSGWIFMHQIRIKVNQLSLSHNTFRFWKAVKDQGDAVGSLFQPVSGKVPVNFIQLSGSESPVQGLFYAAAISSKSFYIRRSDIPNKSMLSTIGSGCVSCLDLFPNATNIKPSFWED